MNNTKYIYLLSLGAMIFEYGPHKNNVIAAAIAPTTDQRSNRIDVDTYPWRAAQEEKYDDVKIEHWENQVYDTQDAIANSTDKAQCGRERIAEAYVSLFFPTLEGEELKRKIAEIEQILNNKENQQANHRTFSHGAYGNEDFFKQTAVPL
ncbi:MAG: hypothetical protein LBJ13_00705, partial [Puniceicoccales bacterium]|nr:hypothetical protein [Puniceicoccales bacterium]